MIRIFDPRVFYSVLKDPRILEAVDMNEPEEILQLVGRYDVYMLRDDVEGGFIFIPSGDSGWYAAHTLYPIGTGLKQVAKKAKAAIDWMLINTDASTIYAYSKPDNSSAQALMQLAGMTPWMDLKVPHTRHYYKKDLDSWAPACSTARSRGESFHNELDLISKEELHEDDEIHDSYVGAALLMLEAGNTMKAVDFYNNWAVAVGYEPAVIVCSSPVTIKIDNILLVMKTRNIGMVLCP